MLICAQCQATSTDEAWHWIAILCRVPGGSETTCYCPVCAESEFRYFSRRVRRRTLSEEPQGE
jgi:hypothetical protein